MVVDRTVLIRARLHPVVLLEPGNALRRCTPLVALPLPPSAPGTRSRRAEAAGIQDPSVRSSDVPRFPTLNAPRL